MRATKPKRDGSALKPRMPKWKRLNEYRLDDLVKITFATEADLDDATVLVWGGRLMGIPFDLDPNGPSFIVPKASVRFFTAEGVAFSEHSPCPPYRG